MYNAQTNEILFPHLIPGNMLGGKEHTYNNVNGGVRNIAEFNLIGNKFFGGNVSKLGLIKEYGFYACPHREQPLKVLGFYIHDPEQMTNLGRELLQAKYPNARIVNAKITASVHRELSAEEVARKKELLKQAEENGLSAPLVSQSTVDELEGLIKASASGKSEMKVNVEQLKETVDDRPVLVRKGRPAGK